MTNHIVDLTKKLKKDEEDLLELKDWINTHLDK